MNGCFSFAEEPICLNCHVFFANFVCVRVSVHVCVCLRLCLCFGCVFACVSAVRLYKPHTRYGAVFPCWMCTWMSHVLSEWVMSLYESVKSHTNQYRFIWMGQVSCELAISDLNESYLTSISHASHVACACQCVKSYMNKSCVIWTSRVSHPVSHPEVTHVMSHVHINESCLIWVSHTWYVWDTSHGSHIASAYQLFVSYTDKPCLIRMSHVSFEWVMFHMNESCLIRMSHVSFEWVMSHINRSRVLGRMCISMSHIVYERVMSCRTSHVSYQ